MNITDNPYYRQALRFVEEHDLNTLATGKHIIDGDNLWVNIVETDLRDIANARLEAHDRYIDLQLPLSASEQFGVRARQECQQPDGPFNDTDDIVFFADAFSDLKTVVPGEMIAFAPDEAHAPLIGQGKIRKAIFKIRVTE